MGPSPHDEAQLFTEPNSTTPTTKFPGTVFSSRYGSRSYFQRFPALVFKSGPANTNPLGSRATQSGSHSVLGAAPMKAKTVVAGRVSNPVGVLTTISARWPLPFNS